ncbi:MAG: L-threonylcarbamoyladenylate synthase [Bacteroidetes bacterium]|nr:L-threonylcarbamoyladenylate synthase [Bacteroidota bacterium]
MKTEIYELHSKNPEVRELNIIVNRLRNSEVMLYPTDTGFTLGCQLGNKAAIEKLRWIRKLSDKKSLTFLCNNLSNISEYANVSNLAYRTIRRLIPGPYTFILPATKLLPRLAMHPTRKTAGIRVPDCNISQSIISVMEEPIISISAKIDTESEEDYLYLEPDDIIEKFYNLVDIVVASDNYNFKGESTVIDMVSDNFKIMREGANLDEVVSLID